MYPEPNVFDVVAARDRLADFTALRAVEARCWLLIVERDVPDVFLAWVVERDVVVRPVFVVARCVTVRDDVAVLRDEIAVEFCR